MRRRPPRNPLFSRRRFEDNVIIRCVRWYLRFKLSYRDLAEIAGELGVSVAPGTILRWVVRYSEEFANDGFTSNSVWADRGGPMKHT